jgi:hypothetical protein
MGQAESEGHMNVEPSPSKVARDKNGGPGYASSQADQIMRN